jgi:hypothetical protein
MITIETSGYGYSKRLCEDVVCWFVSKCLPRHKLEIEVLHRGLNREGALGYCDITETSYRPRSFLIELNTYLDKKTYTTVLLHELIHLLQWVNGDLKLKASKMHYKGKCVEDLEYWKKPHEVEAHKLEKILYNEYIKDKYLTDP